MKRKIKYEKSSNSVVLFLERSRLTSKIYVFYLPSVVVSRRVKDKNIGWSFVDMKIVGGANELSSEIVTELGV